MRESAATTLPPPADADPPSEPRSAPPAAPVDPTDTGHDYDGIRELDNRLPNWWLATLFATVVFGYGYWFYYHVLDRPGLVATLAAEEAAIARAQADSKPATDEMLIALSKDPETVGQGQALFKQQCVACHGDGGEGKIGPNLTDASWLHGGRPSQIHATVSSGVTAKGMPAWGPVLGAAKVRALAAYLETIKGANLPGKAPEGEKLQ